MASTLEKEHEEANVAFKDELKVDVRHDEVLTNELTMNDAFDGENYEHNQTFWQAVKAHPKACFWAFTFCFTIVSIPVPVPHLCGRIFSV